MITVVGQSNGNAVAWSSTAISRIYYGDDGAFLASGRYEPNLLVLRALLDTAAE